MKYLIVFDNYLSIVNCLFFISIVKITTLTFPDIFMEEGTIS